MKIEKKRSSDGKHEYETITLPNILKEKVGSGGVNPELIKAAEAHIVTFEEGFKEKTKKLIDDLKNASKKLNQNDKIVLSNQQWSEFSDIAHVLKGEGGTFGYPFVSIIADTFIRYLDQNKNTTFCSSIISAHIDALSAVISHNIKQSNHPVAIKITESLEKIISQKK